MCAPAGSGKTSLLAAWASGGTGPVAWLSLDEGDNDPARFWRHVAAALEWACPGIGGRAGPLLGPLPPRSFEGVVTALINELAGQPAAGQALLVLDDYHLASSQPVHASVTFLLEQHFDTVYFTGGHATLPQWLSALPADLARSRPRLALARAFMALTGGDLAAAQQAVTTIGQDPEEAGDSFRPSAGAAASFITNVAAAAAIARAWLAYLHGDADQMTQFAAQADARLRDGDWLLASIWRLVLALAGWLAGRLSDAEQGFTALTGEWRAAGQHHLAALGCNFLGQIRCAQGNLNAALDAYRELLQIAAPRAAHRHPRRGSDTWASPASATTAVTSMRPAWNSMPGCRCVGSSAKPRRWQPAWPPSLGSGTRKEMQPGRGRRWPRPNGPVPARPSPACSTRSPR